MPVVPRRSPYVPSSPVPAPRLPTGAFQPPEPVDISPVQRYAARLAEQERQRQNEVALLDADNKLAQLQTDLSIKATSFKGKDALEAGPAVQTDWQKSTDEIRQGLSNDDQRNAFDRRASGRYQSLYAHVAEHTDSELKAYDAETTETGLKLAVDNAVTNYTDPASIARSVEDSKTIVDLYARRQGLPDDSREAKKKEVVSQIHTGVLSRMLANGEDLAASKYYAANKADITGAAQTKLEGALEEGSIRGESQRQADKILRQSGIDRRSALDATRSIEDPRVRDETARRINQYFSEKATDDREQREADMLTATNIVEKSGSIDDIPPTMWSTFTIGERESLKNYVKAVSKGVPIETDWNLFYDMQQMASSDATRDRFLKTNLLQYRSRLGDTEFKQLSALQASLRKGEKSPVLDGVRTSLQIMNDGLNAVGIDPTPKQGSRAARQVNQFKRAVDEQVSLLEQDTGKKAKPEDVQNIVDNLLVRGKVHGKLFGIFDTFDKKFEFETSPTDTFIIDAKDVPQGERLKIEDALRRNNQPITDANVLRLYQQKLAGQ